MLKHLEKIRKLTTEQKLDLIADVTSLGSLSTCEEGFEYLKVSSLNCKSAWLEYPSFSGLINSWDENLIGRVTDDVLNRNKKEGATLVELPDVGFKVSPYSEGASEDPLLCSRLAKAVALSSNKNGVSTCVCDPKIKKADGEYLDKEYSPRIQKEFLELPYKYVKNSSLKAIKISKAEEEWQYTQANDKILEILSDGVVTVYDGADKGEFVKHAVIEGRLFVNGCREALVDAVETYEKLMKSFEACEISLSDVNKACESGMALSPEMIDDAVDKILCFAENCKPSPFSAENNAKGGFVLNKKENKPLSVIAGEESIVMLKNKMSALPLNGKDKVCLIGKIAGGKGGLKDYILSQIAQRNIAFAGYALGYGGDRDISSEFAVEAEKLALQSSTVLLAVGFDEEQSKTARKNKNMRLPANQEALVNRICKLGKKVILLVYGDNAIDMDFDKMAQGVLLVPSGGSAVAEAVVNVLYGKGCPGGRLANTRYANTDEVFESIKRYKDSGRNDVGIYHGYRLYTSLKQKVKYPFGYGLSYTSFQYYGFVVNGDYVSLKVKNTGNKIGSELIQFYVGKKNSKIMRAERELKAFYKVRLNPGEIKSIYFKLSDLDLKVYSETKKKTLVEKGEYELYVCSNASDVKLKSTFYVAGETINDSEFVKSRYLQTEGNIKDGKYYLEEPSPTPKFAYETTRKISVGLSYLMIFVLTIYLYLYFTKWASGTVLEFCLFGGFTLLPIIIANVMKAKKNNIINSYIKKNKIMKKENRSKLNFDLLCEEIPYEQLFIEEFETSVIEIEKEEAVTESNVKEDVFINETFNPDFTMLKATEELTLYMKERGIYVDTDSIRSLFASFASSRLIFLNADDKELLYKFIDLLGRYFKRQSVGVDYSYLRENGGDVINTLNGTTPIAKALIDKENNLEKICIMTVSDIESGEVKSCLQQVIKYVDQPDKQLTFSVLSDGNTYDMPNNVWFVLTLGDEQKAVDIPKYILETACVLDLMMRPIEESVVKPIIKEVETENVAKEQSFEEISFETIDSEQTESQVSEVVSEGGAQVEAQIDGDIESTSEEDEDAGKTPVEFISYYQFTKMIDLARRNNMLDETLWKRLDKLEDYVVSLDGTYRINNKMWQRIEKYVSVYLSAGGSQEEAVDNVVAHHVINTMITSVASNKGKDSEKFSNVIENVFGEGHVPHSIKTIKSTGLKI